MKLSRRDFLKSATIGAAGVALAACASPTPAPTTAPKAGEPTKQPAPAGPVTITYLVRTDIQPTLIKWGEQTVDEFQKKNSNIKVEMVGVPWGDYNAKLLAMYAAGTPPEVSANYAAGFGTFLVNKAITNLDDYIKADKVDLNVLEKSAVDSVTRDGKLWALPLANQPMVFFYNKDLFDQAGAKIPTADWTDKSWNHDAFVTASKAISKDMDDPKKAVWGSVYTESHFGTLLFWRYGVDPLNNQGGPDKTAAYKTGKVTEVFFDQPKCIEAMQWLVDLTHKLKVSPRTSDTDALNQAVGWSFLSGRIGMFSEGTWRLGDIFKANLNFKWGMAPLPFGPSGSNLCPIYNDSWMLCAKSKNPDAGWKFLKYVGLEEGAKLYAEVTGFMPAKKDLFDLFYDSVMKAKGFSMTREDMIKVFTGGFKDAFPTPGKTIDRFPEFNTAWNQTTAPIKNAEVKVEEGMKAVQAKFKSLVTS